ncbi:Intracellular distribution of mitochondria [Borealophlyctis nickersoniae]|nr:Intracellular distribution of mitochondria [Borealophlyctis nickersoniae]
MTTEESTAPGSTGEVIEGKVNGRADATADGSANGALSEEAMAELKDVVEDQTFPLNVVLPGGSGKLTFVVQVHTLVQDIRQVIYDSPDAQFRTCFYLAFDGKRVSDLLELGEIEGFTPDSELTLVEDLYTDREVRVHVTRLRELLTNFQSPLPTHGVDQGATFLSYVGGDAEIYTSELTEKEDVNGKNKKKGGKRANGKAKTEQDGPHPFKDYRFDGSDPGSVANLVPKGYGEHYERCLNSLSISVWNPPPFPRRLAGDLMYLTVTTLEKDTVHITCSASGFYVNRSTGKDFDPLPRAQKSCHSHTLPETLSLLSPSFKARFSHIQDSVARRHPYEYLSSACAVYPWAVRSRPHQSDPGRTMDLHLVSADVIDGFGSGDWNENLQTARELPRTTAQERVSRDSAVFKAHSDFVEAAARGAMAVLDGSVMAMNPLDPEPQQMFLHNNIFYSQPADQYDRLGGLEGAHVAVSKDVDGVQLASNLDIDGLHTLGTAVVDYKGKRIVAQTIIPGIFKKSSAQDTTVQYGSVETGKEISTDSAFHELAGKFANALHLAEHVVLDDNGNEHTLHTSVDTKGILGTDGRRYLLDLYRITPPDIWFREEVEKEAETNPYPHQITLLRPELVDFFYDHKLRAFYVEHADKLAKEKAAKGNEKGAEAVEDKTQQQAEQSNEERPKDPSELSEEQTAPEEALPKFTLTINPDVFTISKLGGTEEEIEAQESIARQASDYLNGRAIQRLVEELIHKINVPVDGEALTKLFHRRGINMRYLGKVVKSLEQEGSEHQSSYAKAISLQEMAARGAKHVLRDILKDTPRFAVSDAIAHFLSCFFASSDKEVPYVSASIHTKLSSTAAATSELTPSSLHASVQKEVRRRFRYELPDDFYLRRRIQTLRSICLKVGIQIEARDYAWDSDSPIFRPEDIINLYPIVKHAQPKAAFAEEAFEHGRYSLAQDQRQTGIELMREAATIYEQVYGPVHPETGNTYAALAMTLYQDEDYENAKALQRKAVIIGERTNGLDDADTLQQYMNLAYFEFASGNAHLGLKYMRHAMTRWEMLVAGEEHTDTASAYSNIGAMLQKLQDQPLSNTFHQRACEINENLLGKNHLITLSSYETLVRCYVMVGDFRKAMNAQRSAYHYYRSRLGDDHNQTKQSEVLLKTLTERAVVGAKKEKEDAAKVKKRSTKGSKSGAAASPATESPNGASSPSKGHLPLEDLLRYIGEPGSAGVVGSAAGKKKARS